MGKKLTKTDQLIAWMKQKQVFYTHEVVEWGLKNYFTSADRVKRRLVEQGLVEKVRKEDRFDDRREALYAWVGDDDEI